MSGLLDSSVKCCSPQMLCQMVSGSDGQWVHNTDCLLEVTDEVTVAVAWSKELDKVNAICQLCKAIDTVKYSGNTIEETILG